jgi:hypothetical protein
MRYPEAEWLGGALNNSDNFKPLITVIIENQNNYKMKRILLLLLATSLGTIGQNKLLQN